MKWRTIRVRFQGQGDAISSGFDCVSVSLFPALGSAIRSCGVSMITAKSPASAGIFTVHHGIQRLAGPLPLLSSYPCADTA